MEELLTVADELVKTLSHAFECKFQGCTCGKVQKQRALSLEYWRLRRGTHAKVQLSNDSSTG